MRTFLFLLLILPELSFSQDHQLKLFDNLVNKTWQAEGKWGDGSTFKQSIRLEYSLDSTIVITKSKGFTDKAQKIFGERNHGIRKYDAVSEEILFWEFDVFGGLTQGVVKSKGNDILYQYQYGDSFVSEIWEYQNDSTYNFKVGRYKDGKWDQVYLSTVFKTREVLTKEQAYSKLKINLKGEWSSKAWDGQLNESWSLDKNGQITQCAQYLEKGEVLYEATNKIELVNNEIILFSVIKESNPKIFKATSFSEKCIVFENSDYKNPNKVVYYFLSENEFHRTISGEENDKPTEYTFKFKQKD